MSIVLDGTLGIQRDNHGNVANVVWFLYGLPEDAGKPENAVFLNQSFGAGSPQMMAFDCGGEEYVVYADWEGASEHQSAASVKSFYQTYGHTLLACLKRQESVSESAERKEWLVPVKYFEDYVTMINEFSKAD